MFVNELLSTSENETVIKMKDYIYNTIKTPLIQEIFKYEFETPQTDSQLENIRLLMLVYFGFYSNDMTTDYCLIDMRKFLE